MLEIRRWQDRSDFVIDFKDVAGQEGIDIGSSLTRSLYDARQHDVARTAYETTTRELQLPPRRDPLTATTLYNLAYLACRFGDEQRARDIYDALLPYGSLFTSTTVARPVGWHYLGMLAATFGQHDIGRGAPRSGDRGP